MDGGDQSIIWGKSIKALVTGLGRVGPPKQLRLSPRDLLQRSLEIVCDMS